MAITGEPDSGVGPKTWARLPLTSITAPIRMSSGTCWKRFSNTVSRIVAVPSARVISAMSWAWRSVGNPGWGEVSTSTAASAPSQRTRIAPSRPLPEAPSRSTSTLAPARSSTSSSGSRCSGTAPSSVTSPPVRTAPIR